jgi:hypothetical protein
MLFLIFAYRLPSYFNQFHPPYSSPVPLNNPPIASATTCFSVSGNPKPITQIKISVRLTRTSEGPGLASFPGPFSISERFGSDGHLSPESSQYIAPLCHPHPVWSGVQFSNDLAGFSRGNSRKAFLSDPSTLGNCDFLIVKGDHLTLTRVVRPARDAVQVDVGGCSRKWKRAVVV